MSREKAGRRENIYLPEMDLSARYDPSRNPVRGERERARIRSAVCFRVGSRRKLSRSRLGAD